MEIKSSIDSLIIAPYMDYELIEILYIRCSIEVS